MSEIAYNNETPIFLDRADARRELEISDRIETLKKQIKETEAKRDALRASRKNGRPTVMSGYI